MNCLDGLESLTSCWFENMSLEGLSLENKAVKNSLTEETAILNIPVPIISEGNGVWEGSFIDTW